MSGHVGRELTPADLRVLEPDLLGALSLVLHGKDGRAPPPLSSPRAERRRPTPEPPRD